MEKKNIKKLIIGIAIVLLIVLFKFSGLYKYVTFEKFVQNRQYLLYLVNKHYLMSVLIFCVVYILTVLSTLPLAGPLTVIGGFLFGTFFGAILSIISGTIGSVIAILIFRYFFGNRIQQKYSDKLAKFNNNISKYGSSYILMLQLTGLIPFFIVNILVSLTNISLITFTWTTAIGITPIDFIYAFAGRQLSEITCFSQILSPKLVVALILLALFSLTTLIIKRYKKDKL